MNRSSVVFSICVLTFAAGPGPTASKGLEDVIWIDARSSSVIVDLTDISQIDRLRVDRLKTPKGVASVLIRPSKKSDLPPARNIEIEWSIYLQVAVIVSPPSIPLQVRLPVLPNHSDEPIRVNGRAIATRGDGAGALWSPKLTGGYNKVVIPSTDAE